MATFINYSWQEPMDVENENSLSVVSKKTENSPKGPLGLIFVHSSILLFVKRVFTRILWSSRFASINQTNISLFCLVLFSSTAAQWFQHCLLVGSCFFYYFYCFVLWSMFVRGG